MIDSWVSKKYSDEKHIHLLKNKFLKAKPFPYFVIDGLFDDMTLKQIFHSLLKENFERKESDLFSLYQTQDFESSDNALLQELRKFLMSKEFVYLMESMTGLKLKTGKISIAGSLYEDGDYLLCHDDRLEGRKIAFMIYLSDLKTKEGGSLDLFSALQGKPLKRVQSIQPKLNRFVCFEVSPTSFHQVSEVIGKQRFAMGGWWYGK